MIRTTLTGLVCLSIAVSSYAQDLQEGLFTLHKALAEAKEDSSRVNAMDKLSRYHRYYFNRNDSAVYYGVQVLQQARKLGMVDLEIRTLLSLGLSYAYLGDYAMKRSLVLKSLKLSRLHNAKKEEGESLLQLGVANSSLGNHELAKKRYLEAIHILRKTNQVPLEIIAKSALGMTYYDLGKVDSAFFYLYDALKRTEKPRARPLYNLGDLHYYLGSLDSSLYYYNKQKQLYPNVNSRNLVWKGRVFYKKHQLDSAQLYARRALDYGLEKKDWRTIISSALLFSDIHETRDPAEALAYSKMALAYTDSLNTMRMVNANENITDYNEQVQQYEIDLATSEYENRLKQYAMASGILVLLVIGSILYFFYRQKHKSNTQLAHQRDALNAALGDLKSTQSQLIHAEKMASLGELTAGIAHEIQNPLNFVNNFSEVSRELLEELATEIEKGDWDEVKALAADLNQNLEKIAHHGKRADGIVKGMLQHSRSGDGKKEPTDLNALAEEYLRLAYHGMRAKDKSFNATLETDLGPQVGLVSLVPQEIGRVLLNLLTNAFQAVNEKAREGQPGYVPKVTLKTTRKDRQILVSVADNGSGIPEAIREKVFQPFFTTKPTGSGTGLGLSLSYDIVKAHGGELRVSSQEGSGSEFTLNIPAV